MSCLPHHTTQLSVASSMILVPSDVLCVLDSVLFLLFLGGYLKHILSYRCSEVQGRYGWRDLITFGYRDCGVKVEGVT